MKTSIVLAGLVALPAALAAQGNISTQGYGYPQGQLTTRSLSMGGATGETDPSGTLNPASLGRITTRTVLFQIEPEFRKVTANGVSDATTTARYPLVSVGVPFGERWVIGVSASSLLDRSWSTSTTRDETIGGDEISTTFRESSNGSINDLRLAAAWTNRTWLSIGGGVHGITGRNVVVSSQGFDDPSFDDFTSSRTLSYSGTALSAGLQMLSTRYNTIVGIGYRMGGSLRVRANDTTLATGDVPDHFGAALSFTGLTGTTLSVRAGRDQWSSMSSMLTSTTEKAHDSWDLGAGGEFTGPRLLGQLLMIRAGARARTLPFEAAGRTVDEKTLSLGTGTAFGGGRISADITGARQWRDASLPGISERAWTLSISLTARP